MIGKVAVGVGVKVGTTISVARARQGRSKAGRGGKDILRSTPIASPPEYNFFGRCRRQAQLVCALYFLRCESFKSQPPAVHGLQDNTALLIGVSHCCDRKISAPIIMKITIILNGVAYILDR